MSKQIDANELINGLIDQIGEQAKEIALLKVQLSIHLKSEESEGGELEDGGNTV